MRELGPPRGALPPLLKNLNERTVLEAIRDGSPISRAEISRRAGISKPTVSLALKALLQAGLVRESPAAVDGPTYGAAGTGGAAPAHVSATPSLTGSARPRTNESRSLRYRRGRDGRSRDHGRQLA